MKSGLIRIPLMTPCYMISAQENVINLWQDILT